MPKPSPDVVRINTPSDVVCTIEQVLGFVPTNSIVVLCLHGERNRLGLAMRFDLRDADPAREFARHVEGRLDLEGAESAFIVVFADLLPQLGEQRLPYAEVVDRLEGSRGWRVMDAFYVARDRWWSYLCDDERCCPVEGGQVDRDSVSATAIAAAHALAGHAVLPSRDALVASIGYDGNEADAIRIGDLIDAARDRLRPISRPYRQRAVKALVIRLLAGMNDPRASVSDPDLAELVALCDDVVVRDEVLLRARKPRHRAKLIRLLSDVARRTPPPDDAPVCATLAWVAYAAGSGVLANVAIDRALSTDPTYSLALLIGDALYRQVPPWVLEEVMRGAARDLREQSQAG